MSKEIKETDAVDLLHRRYIGDNPERKVSLQEERVNAEVARTIYELRQEAGLTQKDLADLIGTTQSVISRLEDSDYEGHSLSMLSRIAKALNKSVKVQMTSVDGESNMMRYVFREVIKGLRKEKGLSIEKFSQKIGIDREYLASLERAEAVRPSPIILHKISKFFDISERSLAILAGAIRQIPEDFKAQASSFAAKSELFSKLTREERRTLDEFVRFLRREKEEGDR